MLSLTLDQALAVHDAQGQLLLRLPLPVPAQGRFPPTPAQLEQAIAHIEDALMRQLPALAGRPGPLHSHSAASNALREPAGLPFDGVQWLSRQSLEALFNRLADAANGAPLRQLGLPEDRLFAAHLTALRELLHHADLDGVWLHP
ncbi:hypothetical protein ABB30_12930 [Stenotrophomonas ginsengisoli]|uniref:Uncharacterized protein n=1 Tax=Stenotrophomonas ginsengisoli TaxID=336566 RepID=A0A0R0CZ60_9GAMM|nr:hypothetical protein [Stenotrophomonas ginsengisoli]KRG75085.1 hypothetical protein ABB30_12930 [Stenotrophomonas ginsengisoli]